MTQQSNSPNPSDWAMDKWREANERGDNEASRNYQYMYEMWRRREAEAVPQPKENTTNVSNQ